MSDDEVMDLDGTHPPFRPVYRSVTMAFRCPPDLAEWVRVEAERDGVEPSVFLRRLVTRSRDEGGPWPADVRYWLRIQASQCDTPGDLDNAVIEVVRHLARRWPTGCRLTPPEP